MRHPATKRIGVSISDDQYHHLKNDNNDRSTSFEHSPTMLTPMKQGESKKNRIPLFVFVGCCVAGLTTSLLRPSPHLDMESGDQSWIVTDKRNSIQGESKAHITSPSVEISSSSKNDLPYHSHCIKFDAPPPPIEWDDVYALEWNGTPSIVLSGGTAKNVPSNTFPTTRFTSHVQSLLELMDIEQMEEYCHWKFTLMVHTPDTTPSNIICQGRAQQRIVPWWCVVLKRLFFRNDNSTIPSPTVGVSSSNPHSANLRVKYENDEDDDNHYETSNQQFPLLYPTLPGSVSFAISSDDYYRPPRTKSKITAPYTCLANSAPNNGTFAITNFLELQRMADQTSYPILPWHQRCSVPIWRGSAWIYDKKRRNENNDNMYFTGESNLTVRFPILSHALQGCPRCRAVEFSGRFPDLLDAKFGDAKNGFFHPAANPQYRDWWKYNRTNGLDRLLPIQYIPPIEYYTQYQVALVLCGIGAAFRTPIHFSTATAVMLQECPHQEWYHALVEFQAWKHYIPLQADLSDLHETLTWVKDHPMQVHAIAMAGRQFYQDYLSFQRNYEHFYELIYRLALKKQQ